MLDTIREWWQVAVILVILGALGFMAWRQRGSFGAWRTRTTAAWATVQRIPGEHPAKVLLATLGLAALYWAVKDSGLMPLVFLRIVISGWAALLATIFAVVHIPPVMDGLTIKPNRKSVRPDGSPAAWPYPVSRRGFFTGLKPGRVKMRETPNGSFINPIMDYDGMKFIGETAATAISIGNQRQFWKVVNTPMGEQDSHPIPFPEPKGAGFEPEWWQWLLTSPFSLTWWALKRYIYWLNGGVFIGPPNWRTVHMYIMDRFSLVVEGGVPVVRQVTDWSDHYRVAQFEFPLLVPSAETQNMVPMKALLNVICRVTNPYLVAYNTDDQWSHRLLAAASAALGMDVRGKPVRDVHPATTADEVKRLLNIAVADFGLEVDQVQSVDLTPADPVHASRLAEPELAEADRIAAESRAKGNAAPLRESGQALQDYPEAALVAQEEIRVRVAQAMSENPNAIVFLGGSGGGQQTIDFAQFAELRKLRQQGQLPPLQPPQPAPPPVPPAGP